MNKCLEENDLVHSCTCDKCNYKKALEIIKEKIKIDFDDHYFGFKDNYYIIVNHDVFGAIKVDKEQFDLLKEVLR